MIRLLIACGLALAIRAAEWPFTAAGGATASLPMAADALTDAGALRLEVSRAETDDDCWVEVRILAADGRRFCVARPVHLPVDERSATAIIGLSAGSWAGRDGCLGADALSAISAIEVLAHGASRDQAITGRIATVPLPGGDPAFAVQDAGLWRCGPWHEWRLRLCGAHDAERGSLDLVLADGRRLPLFLDQPGSDSAGRWRGQGPPRWVLRLNADELTLSGRLEWQLGSRQWTSAGIRLPAVAGDDPLAVAPVSSLPVPRTQAWTADAYRLDDQGWLRIGRTEAPDALAPVLAWRSDWTGFRGPSAIAWVQARSLDQALAGGMAAIDLLPDGLAEERGAFRFGLSPWSAAGGPWHAPRDLWADDRPWAWWPAHVRHVVARCRATPGLSTWLVGAQRSANDPDGVARLMRVAGGVASLVAAIDRRPCLARHPQLAGFARTDPQGMWFGFDQDVQGWKLGPPPLAGQPQVGKRDQGGCLDIPITPGEGVRVGGAWVAVDANLFNLDRIECDVALEGGGEATLYAWVTDHRHRWYQQRIDRIPGDGGWQTIGIDTSGTAAWTTTGEQAAWDDTVRRRIRALGIVAYVRGAGAQARLRLDRIRRLGWPRAQLPGLDITRWQAAPATVARWQPLRADFALTLPALNPYDPDEADVVGEVEGPQGQRLQHPAYWAEPMRLVFDGTTESVVPDGAGAWHWRWTPPTPGVWRYRIVARIKQRGAWQRCEGPWCQTTVAPGTADGLPPVRQDAQDPRWFATADGSLFYPIGINLRSPGDERQDPNLERERLFRPQADEQPAVRGMRSLDFQRMGTRAYERWLSLMAGSGMNWARVWMCPWWMGLEWRREWDDYGGLMWYSQANAARMDRVCELAAQHRVYLQVELLNHGMVGDQADRQWADSPFNRANGGPVARVADWFRSDDVWKIHEKRLRYTLARWGWCTQIAAWSLCSEMEFTGTHHQETGGNDYGHSMAVEKWVKRSLGWFHQIDPVPQRPVTIHFSHPWSDPELWRTKGLGFSNSNAYTAFQDFDPSLGRGKRVPRNLPLALDCYIADLFSPDELRRPTLVGEWGGHWSDNDPQVLRGELRTGLWLQACLPYAGNTGWWWWLWLDISDTWGEFAAVGRFVAGEDPRGVAWQVVRPKVDGGHGRVVVLGMQQPKQVRLYAHVRGFDQDHRRRMAGEAGTVQITGMGSNSLWRVERWDCQSGTVVERSELRSDEHGRLRLPMGRLDPDVAWKLNKCK